MRHIYTFLALIGLTACALSPQIIVVNPELKMAANAANASPITISIEVVDTRSSTIIGQRGGVYAETSNLSTDDKMTATLERRIGTAFSELGYMVAKKGADADADLTVKIINVHYAATTEKKVLQQIETRLEIQAVCKKNDREFTGSYSATRKKDFIKLPTENENQELLNGVFTVVLESMMKDKDLSAFIDG